MYVHHHRPLPCSPPPRHTCALRHHPCREPRVFCLASTNNSPCTWFVFGTCCGWQVSNRQKGIWVLNIDKINIIDNNNLLNSYSIIYFTANTIWVICIIVCKIAKSNVKPACEIRDAVFGTQSFALLSLVLFHVFRRNVCSKGYVSSPWSFLLFLATQYMCIVS